MFSRRSYLLVASVLLLITAGVIYFWLQSPPPSAAHGDEDAFFARNYERLPPADVSLDCGQSAEIRKRIAVPYHYWQSDESAVPESFIFFDEKGRALQGCHRGESFGALIYQEVGGPPGGKEMFRLNDAQMADVDEDGKPEFFFFHGECRGSFCSGRYALARVSGAGIERLYSIAADEVRIYRGGERPALIMTQHCYSDKFEPLFKHFSVAVFASPETIKAIPQQRVREIYPEVLDNFTPLKNPGVHAAMQTLINEAYAGRPTAEILERYKVIEADLRARGPHCDPPAILRQISGSI